MEKSMHTNNEIIDFRNIQLPIGSAKAQGPIEDFTITIFAQNGITYRFRATGGNICSCSADTDEDAIEYEVM